MTLLTAWLALVLGAGPALAQDNRPIEALGTFDQIAVECGRDGSESDIDAYRLKLWRAYLGTDKIESDQDLKDMIVSLRRQIADDASDELRRQYKSARAAIPEAKSLSDADQAEFYKLCASPRIQGLPDRR
jgi:hypothetical protein